MLPFILFIMQLKKLYFLLFKQGNKVYINVESPYPPY